MLHKHKIIMEIQIHYSNKPQYKIYKTIIKEIINNNLQ
jgi:hypothetical protein